MILILNNQIHYKIMRGILIDFQCDNYSSFIIIISLFCCCIMFVCQLTAILVMTLLNATAEAVSDNRELTWVFHQIISP